MHQATDHHGSAEQPLTTRAPVFGPAPTKEGDVAREYPGADANFTPVVDDDPDGDYWAYSDSDRLDELMTADDYNRFEEEQLALDRDHEAYLDELADLAGDEAYIEEAMGE